MHMTQERTTTATATASSAQGLDACMLHSPTRRCRALLTCQSETRAERFPREIAECLLL